MSLIEKLTPEQEALIPVYREKWRKIAFSTERIDREKVTESVKAAYALIGISTPKIIFFESPYIVYKIIVLYLLRSYLYRQLKAKDCNQTQEKILFNQLKARLKNQLNFKIGKSVESAFYYQIKRPLRYTFKNQLENHPDGNKLFIDAIRYPLTEPMLTSLTVQISNQLEVELRWYSHWEKIKFSLFKCHGYFNPTQEFFDIFYYDFYISLLNLDYDINNWKVYQSLVKDCGWIFPYENICIICDRPLHLRFDNQNRLHAEGEPAIEFIDGYSLYSYHGVTLPEQYGKIHPNQWQANWLLSEKNAELRRVLIQGIGYARICQELQAVKIDTWAEYTLLKIDADVDEEPIYLLKMTCPSTKFTHVLRVPPDIETAREAIRWVNWGIDPEEFSLQT